MRIGVLALQGAFAAHARVLRELGHAPIEVREARDLEGCGGLILPGGESTVQLRLLERANGLARAMDALRRAGAPILATCAGLILIANEVKDPEQPSLGWLDVTVHRNAFGPQLHSRETVADDGTTPILLIRAPRITRCGADVSIEATLAGDPILVRHQHLWAATFHPELSGPTLHSRIFPPPTPASRSSDPSRLDHATTPRRGAGQRDGAARSAQSRFDDSSAIWRA